MFPLPFTAVSTLQLGGEVKEREEREKKKTHKQSITSRVVIEIAKIEARYQPVLFNDHVTIQ